MLRRDGERGAIAIIVAIFALVMFTLAALVVDLGFARETRREAQNTADAAALAGAGELYSAAGVLRAGPSIAAVKQYAARNFGTTNADWAGCNATVPAGWTTVVGGQPTNTTCIAYDSGAVPKKVQVAVPTKHTGSFFGGIVGYRGSDISALAQASLQPDSSVTCVVCVLGDWAGQNGDALVVNGGVAINGNLSVGPNGSITAAGIGVAGTGLPESNLNPAGTQIAHFTDPLADIPLPPAVLGQTAVDGAGACTPGSYISVLGCSSFATGVYVIVGDNKLTGQQSLVATPAGGVLFYFACSTTTGHGNNAVTTTRACATSGEAGGSVEAAGQGAFSVTGRAYAGRTFAIVYDRNNTADMRLVGNGATSITGDIYGARSLFDARGNGAFSVNSLIVTGSFRFSGNPSSFTDNYTGTPGAASGPDALRLVK